jgi:NAD(P)-dependent dehydrogenase (short-subunit alcohol dehydrogenase family)
MVTAEHASEPEAAVKDQRLTGKVVLLSGAGGPIGRGIAQRLSWAGASVVLVDDDPKLGAQTLKLIQDDGGLAFTVAGDAADRDQAKRIVAEAKRRFGRIDVLVAAAEYATPWTPLADKSEAMISQAMKAFYATLWMMQAVFPVMRDGGGGSIIALGSTYGYYAQSFIADYKAAKEAIKGLVLSAAHEWGPCGIRVNVLEAAADTADFQLYRAEHETDVAASIALLPMRRMGDPVRDVGGAALFLASDDSRYLTGEIIHADGGEHLSAPVFEPLLMQGKSPS